MVLTRLHAPSRRVMSQGPSRFRSPVLTLQSCYSLATEVCKEHRGIQVCAHLETRNTVLCSDIHVERAGHFPVSRAAVSGSHQARNSSRKARQRGQSQAMLDRSRALRLWLKGHSYFYSVTPICIHEPRPGSGALQRLPRPGRVGTGVRHSSWQTGAHSQGCWAEKAKGGLWNASECLSPAA